MNFLNALGPMSDSLIIKICMGLSPKLEALESNYNCVLSTTLL